MRCFLHTTGITRRAVASGLSGRYNWGVEVKDWHGWQVGVAQAIALQRRLAVQVSRQDEFTSPRFIAGVDISVGRRGGPAMAAVVVLGYPGLEVVETRLVRGGLDFPYVPGLLSFREAPLILEAFRNLIAHPRRLGLASHLGLFLDTATIGCAKSRLCGEHDMPGVEPGSCAEIVDKGEVVGAVLRTKRGVKPVYVSVGHKVSLEAALNWVLACCRGYRLPEPTRLAHLAAGGNLKVVNSVVA